MKIKVPLYRLVACAAGLLTLAPARADTPLEYAVKAAYLTKFVPFIEWPDAVFTSAGAPVTICILGADPFGATLEKAAVSGTGGGRPLVLRRIAAPAAAAGCQIVYAGDPQTGALDALQGQPVVTVTDSGMPSRGIISFVMLDNHVRFDIDDAAAAKGGIRISSKLLELAHSVTRRSAGP
jgi:hypothetical protein